MKDIVKIHCYNSIKEMEREQAKKEFFQAMMCCEGSERERYTNIYIGLMEGLKEVFDE